MPILFILSLFTFVHADEVKTITIHQGQYGVTLDDASWACYQSAGHPGQFFVQGKMPVKQIVEPNSKCLYKLDCQVIEGNGNKLEFWDGQNDPADMASCADFIPSASLTCQASKIPDAENPLADCKRAP